MINLSIGVLIVFRLFVVIIKFAFNNLTLIDLKKLSSRERDILYLFENRIAMQMTTSIANEFSIAVLGYLFYLKTLSFEKTLLTLFLYLVVEKIITSAVAFASRETVVKILVPVFKPFYYVLKIFVYPSVKIGMFLIKKEDIRMDDEEDKEDEEKAFIDVATAEGIIEEGEKDLIKGVLDFGDTIVREVMTPRTDIIAVSYDVTYDRLIETFKKAKHSRLPVFKDSIDNIVGIVHLKDVLSQGEEKFDLQKIIQEPYFIPETKKVLELLREMQNKKLKMAVVLDEYGGTAGVVTIEDLIEEIVGEIEDEHDIVKNLIQKAGERVYLVDGRCNIDFFEEETGIELDFEDVDTIGGVVFTVFGRIPGEGESVEYENIRFTVVQMHNRRVKTVKIEIIEKDKENKND